MKKVCVLLCVMVVLSLPFAVVNADNTAIRQSVPTDVLEYAENIGMLEIKQFMKNPITGWMGEGELFASADEIDALTLGNAYRVAIPLAFRPDTPITEMTRKMDDWIFTLDDENGPKAAFNVTKTSQFSANGPWDAVGFGEAMSLMKKLAADNGITASPLVVDSGMNSYDIFLSFNGDERVITVPTGSELHRGYSLVRKYTELPTVNELVQKTAEMLEKMPHVFDEEGNQILDISEVPLGINSIELAPHLDPANASASTGESGVNALPFIIGAGVIVIAGVIALGVVLGRRRTVRVK